MQKNITERVRKLAEPVADGMGLWVYDVTLEKENGEKVLRLFAERKEGNISIDECEELSNRLSDLLDEEDIIDGAYIFEVSSPGIERRLKYDKHFEAALGKEIDVKLYEAVGGKKILTGKLISGGEKQNIVIEQNGREVEIERSKAAEVKIHFEF